MNSQTMHEPTNAEIELKHRCPNCGQLMPAVRFGVRLSARKATIIDIIKGNPGISGPELAVRLGCSPATLKQHVWQINNELEESDMRIGGRYGHGRYRLRGHPAFGYRITKVTV